MDAIVAAAGFAVLMAVLCAASVADVRSRTIPDGLWLALGVLGLVMMAAASLEAGPTWRHVSMIAGSAMILADILHDREWPKWADALFYVMEAILFAVPALMYGGDTLALTFLAVPACFLFFMAMYRTGVIAGGADVKCLVTLAMVFPVYPCFGPFPMMGIPDTAFAEVFVFPVAVLLHAALGVVAVFAVSAVIRAVRGESDPGFRFQGRRMRIADAREAFVWPVQDVVDGAVVKVPAGGDSGAYDRLEAHGEEYVQTAYMVPFIVPITAATAFVALVGNLVFLVI